MKDATHFVLPRGRHSMVKVAWYFREQGGLKDRWGRNWIPVRAASIEDAREIASRLRENGPTWPFKNVLDILNRGQVNNSGW